MTASPDRRAGRSRRVVLLTLAVAALAVAAALGSAHASQANTQAGKTLVIARDMDLNSLDPSRAYCDTCQIYLSSTYQTLLGLAPDNKTLVPELATSWKITKGGRVYTFNLNPKAHFDDGTPVTSADVKFSWLRLKNVKGSAAYLVQLVKSINASNPHRVVITLSQPSSEFLNATNATYMGIMNSKLARKHGATDAANAATADKAEPWFLHHSAGSAPFMLQRYVPNAEVDFVRNPKYWGKAPAIQRIVLKEVKDAVSQGQLLSSGGADIAMQIDPITSESIHSKGVSFKTIPSFNFLWLGLSPGTKANTSVKLDPKIRLAIRYAIDYNGLIRTLMHGKGKLQASPIPNGFDGSAGLPLPKTDLNKAKQLLKSDGHASGISITAIYPALTVYGVDFNTVMQLIQSNLGQAGIKVKLQPVTFSVLLNDQQKGVAPMTLIYFAPDYRGSAQYVNFFGLVTGSNWSMLAAGPPSNKPVVNKSEAATFGKALAATNASQRTALYHQLGLDMIKDNVVIPLFSPDLVLAYRSNVRGVFYSACCNLELAKLSAK
jgi:peptide/nickel transport system substrate-binding protein